MESQREKSELKVNDKCAIRAPYTCSKVRASSSHRLLQHRVCFCDPVGNDNNEIYHLACQILAVVLQKDKMWYRRRYDKSLTDEMQIINSSKAPFRTSITYPVKTVLFEIIVGIETIFQECFLRVINLDCAPVEVWSNVCDADERVRCFGFLFMHALAARCLYVVSCGLWFGGLCRDSSRSGTKNSRFRLFHTAKKSNDGSR